MWVPSTGMGTAALAFARQDVQIMQPAYEFAEVDEDGDATKYNLVDCTWHPVKPTGSMIPHPVVAASKLPPPPRLRCEAGQTCPRTGLWSSPAAKDMHIFQQGQIMPDMKSDYGQTIWRFERDTDQTEAPNPT